MTEETPPTEETSPIWKRTYPEIFHHLCTENAELKELLSSLKKDVKAIRKQLKRKNFHFKSDLEASIPVLPNPSTLPPFLVDLFNKNEEELELKAQILRLEPQTFQGIQLSGYLEAYYCPTSLPDIIEQVGKKYGGGKYQIKLIDQAGKYLKSKVFEISGSPKIEHSHPAPSGREDENLCRSNTKERDGGDFYICDLKPGHKGKHKSHDEDGSLVHQWN